MSWYREKTVKATRKAHSCAGCRRAIAERSTALYVSCFTSGDDYPFYGHFHPDCRDAECALNTLHACYANDDWLSLHEVDDEDRVWLRVKFPDVAERLFCPSAIAA